MKIFKKLLCAGILVTLGSNAMASVIYDTTGNANYNGHAFSMTNNQEVGNEITINQGNAWTLTNFSIEYYSAQASFTANVGIDVRFYQNDGSTNSTGFHTPYSLFYNSGWFYNTAAGGLPANGYQTVTYNSSDFSSGNPYLNIALPSDFTFTITFTNLNPANLVELPLANNQSGPNALSYGDYWLNTGGGGWQLMTNASTAANFVVDFSGTIPEPSTFGLAAVGGALLMGISKLRRKR